MIKRIFKRFKLFPVGIRRLLIAGIFVFPFVLGLLTLIVLGQPIVDDEIILSVVFLGIPIYIALVLLSAWIYEGFKIDK